MTEILFYHLEQRPLEDVLPGLLEKCLERGWNAVVQASSQERCSALDSHLWSYREDSFLPHGPSGDPHAADHPICLTIGTDNPNRAVVRFCVERAECSDAASYQRVVHIFDGADEDAVQQARRTWKESRSAGHSVTYWQQDEAGRWQKRGGGNG